MENNKARAKIIMAKFKGGKKNCLQEMEALIEKVEREARAAENLKCQDIILLRTAIPKGAKNPTRDVVVILGEELVELIKR